MSLDIRATPQGSSLAVRAQPGAKKNRITGMHDDALKVSVTAPPEDGRANEAIVRFLAKTLGCRPNQIQLIQGKTDRRKVFELVGISPDSLKTLVEALLKELDT